MNTVQAVVVILIQRIPLKVNRRFKEHVALNFKDDE
jgi:hypothetical protein